jgi:hypothetical protein
MTDLDELDRLVAKLPRRRLEDPDILAHTGNKLRIEWPKDYVRLIADHNGVEGDLGEWRLVLFAVEDLVDHNDAGFMEFFPGLVMIGGDGGGELLALDRISGDVLIVPMIGDVEDWLVIGSNLTEAFQRMERGEVFAAPHRRRDS